MLRTKHEKKSVRSIAPATLCLCYGLAMSLLFTAAYAAQRPQQPYYVVDVYQTPGKVFRIIHGKLSVFFQRRSGNISSIALCNGELYFCPANDRRIYHKIGQRERVVFEYRNNIRDIAVDSRGNMYFSVAEGAKGDGTIYRLTPSVNQVGDGVFSLQSSQPFYTVHLNNVDRFWWGHFVFDARNNLYLSSGRAPAFIYRIQREEGGQYGHPQKLYKDTKGTIKGIAINPSDMNFAYYADWNKTIYKFDIKNSRCNVELSGNIARSRIPHLSDVAFDIRIENE